MGEMRDRFRKGRVLSEKGRFFENRRMKIEKVKIEREK